MCSMNIVKTLKARYCAKISSLPCTRLRLGHRKGSWKIQEQMYNRNQYFQENYPLFISRTRTPPLIDLPYTLPLSLHTLCPPLYWQQNRGPEIFTHVTETKIKEAGVWTSICSQTASTTSYHLCGYLTKAMPGKSIKYTGSPFLVTYVPLK